MNDVNEWVHNAGVAIDEYLSGVSMFRGIIVIIGGILAAFLLNKIITKMTLGFVRVIAERADKEADEEKFIQYRRFETFLSVVLALVRALIIGVVGYIALRLLFDRKDILPATIGVSTFFVIAAGATIAPLLRDLTSGAIMITGRWFSVGDFIKVEPFGDVAGVVEYVSLRSTKLRNINGDVIWLNNQNIQGVRVTPRGVRTLAMDVFVRDLEKGMDLVEEVIGTLPVGPTMIASPLRVTSKENLSPKLWRITVVGKTAPGREWLIEDFIKEALQGRDEEKDKKNPVIVYGPLVRYADASAEKRFSRAVRTYDKRI
ncbi:MAG TPA: mechanosensitive ion channel family protein [Candidatus Saccharimonadales bacterium]|nr:mechanosensitive ion channel family protein [Candidatus Saccharimonadales bacterium]